MPRDLTTFVPVANERIVFRIVEPGRNRELESGAEAPVAEYELAQLLEERGESDREPESDSPVVPADGL